jgi:hypothetical protein
MNIPENVVKWRATLYAPDYSRAEHDDETYNEYYTIGPVFPTPGHTFKMDLAQITDTQYQSKDRDDQKPRVEHLL